MSTETFERLKRYLLVFVCGVCVGGLGFFLLVPARVQNPFTERVIKREVPVMQEKLNQTTQTEIVYVPKAVASEKQDPAADKSANGGIKEKTDLEVQVEKPTVNVKLNGQPYSFALLAGETQKFDQGKISLRQESVIGIDLTVKPQVVNKTKTGGIDLFVGRYAGIGLYHRRIGLDIGTDGQKQDYRLRWRAVEW